MRGLRLFDLSILSASKWEVPWGGKTLALGFGAWVFLFLGIGLLLAPSLATSVFHLDFADPSASDDKAYFLLLDQSLELGAGLGLIWLITRPYAPLPGDLFRFSLARPFDRRDGWLLWALIGIAAGFLGVGLTAYLISFLQVQCSAVHTSPTHHPRQIRHKDDQRRQSRARKGSRSDRGEARPTS